MKKTVSVLLTICLMLALCTPAFAGGGEDALTYETVGSDVPIVRMHFCVNVVRTFSGHCWLYFENLSDFSVPLGYVTLAPHKSMSVGSYSYVRPNGPGTYYNVEAHCTCDAVTASTCSISMELNRGQLETVNDRIRSLNFFLFSVWNCGSFATTVWNSVSGKPIIHITLPVITLLEVLLYGGSFGSLEMEDVPLDRVYKQISGGVETANPSIFSNHPL